MKVKIEKNIPLPSLSKSDLNGIFDEMEVGDSFLLEAKGIAECHNIELKRIVRRIIGHASFKRLRYKEKLRTAQRQQTLEDGRLAFRIWRVE